MSRTIQGSQTGSIQLNPVRGGHDSVGWEMGGGGHDNQILGFKQFGSPGDSMSWAGQSRALIKESIALKERRVFKEEHCNLFEKLTMTFHFILFRFFHMIWRN